MVNLICADASHLGGPMGSEYTTHIFTKTFSTVEKAKIFAEKYQEATSPWKWTQGGNGDIYCDSGAYIWTISKVVIEE